MTPGIRFERQADDQRRAMPPGEAVRAGADYLVGRSVTRAPNRIAALDAIERDITAGDG